MIEFKGYGHGISRRDIHKALGYTHFYMSIDRKVEKEPETKNVTVTVLQYQYPREVFKKLKELGCTVTERTAGVFEIKGLLTPFAYQVVDLVIVDDGWETLKILVPGASEEDIRKVCDEYAEAADGPEREHLETVLKISMENNPETYEKLDKREDTLDSAAKQIFKHLFDEERKNGDLQACEEIAEKMIAKKMPAEEIAGMTGLTMDALLSIAMKVSGTAAST